VVRRLDLRLLLDDTAAPVERERLHRALPCRPE
jgi:hypothetical protein